ncbi:hypothetical protein MMC10_011174 [Thelotrema lepadinum]|nr:hypothetical protein [Thelotrema lepadinum]
MDGTGIKLMWPALFPCLEQPTTDLIWGQEVERLLRSFDDSLNLRGEPTTAQEEEIENISQEYLSKVPGTGPKSDIGKVLPGNRAFGELNFPTVTTARLVRAYKAHGFTVSSAAHAALIATLSIHADPTSKQSIYATAA